MRISVVATGIDLEAAREPRPNIALVSDRTRDEAAKTEPTSKPEPAMAPALALDAAAAPATPAFVLEPDPPQIKAAEAAALGKGGFVPARPAESTTPRPVAIAQPPAPRAAAPTPAPVKKRGMPSLFERVRNSQLMRRETPPAPPPTVAATQHARLGGLDPADRIMPGEREEDALDIPAFLRRQAN
ncbi:MAG: hypothetical protein ACREFQ_07065, partial [Stellaceae bacterium]